MLGNPIDHSLSPSIHRMFAQQANIQMSYDKELLPLNGFGVRVDELVKEGAKGFNVTVPFKGDAFTKVTEADNNATLSMAVNTIKVDDDFKLHGFNTDGIGLVRDLEDRLGVGLANSNILILGAGGAARGIIGPLFECLPSRMVIANRTVETAQKLVLHFKALDQTLPLDWVSFDSIASGFDLIINTTSIGLEGKFDLLEADIVKNKICYDLSYGANAHFVSWARSFGAASAADGLGMLVEQAAESFFIWHGKRPETQPVIEALRAPN